MSHITTRIVAALALSAAPLAANAQSFRAYLASYGSDSNPCTAQQPCRLLPAALNAVVDGGQVWILDSANYNQDTVLIDKNVSIGAVPGQTGSFLAVRGGPALRIQSRIVNLRNVSIGWNSTTTGANGIEIYSGIVSIENSLFDSLPDAGIYMEGGVLNVKNSDFRNVVGFPIWARTTSSGGMKDPTVNVTSSHFHGGFSGLLIDGADASQTAVLNVTDCEIAGRSINNGVGVLARAEVAGSTARAYVTRSTVFNMANGLSSDANNGGVASLTFSGSTITGNDSGVLQLGGTLTSLGNNHILDNRDDVIGTLSTAPLR